MITDKKTVLATLVLLLCLLFCSCQTDTTGLVSPHSLTNAGGEDPQVPASEHDYVILPAAAGDALVARAHRLTADLFERTGIPTTLYFDNEDFLVSEHSRLILLGNIEHPLSQAHLRDLRRDDYLCVSDENALILGGKSDAATMAAIDRFSQALLPYADAEILLNQDQHFLVRADYDVTSATVNGFSLGDYRIVHPRRPADAERAVALALREAIADRCGFYPDVLPDHLVTDDTRIIAIGACFGGAPSDTPQILVEESLITLCGGSEYELAEVAAVFCQQIFPDGARGDVTVTLDTPITVSCTPRTLVTASMLLSAEPNVSEIASTADTMRNFSAALAPLGPIGNDTFHYLHLNISNYSCLPLTPNADTVVPFYYREDLLTLLDRQANDHSQTLRFSTIENNLTLTVIHAVVSHTADADALLDALAQTLPQSELTIVFLVTPASLVLGEEHTDFFRGPYLSRKSDACMQMLVHLPPALSSTEITQNADKDAVISLAFTHPFLRT